MATVTPTDVHRMVDALYIDGPVRGRMQSKFWILLLLAGVIATAGLIGDSVATVIGAMIVASALRNIDEATGWFATDLDINCDTEPDIDGPEGEGWWADHSYDNCEKWHTLHERVVASLKRTHRVNDNSDAGPRGENT